MFMEKNEMLYLRRLFFLVILSAFTLCAQNSGNAADLKEPAEASENSFVSPEEFNAAINALKADIRKNTADYNNLYAKTVDLQIWRIISAISEALIAVFIAGVFVLVVFKKTGFYAVHDTLKTEVDKISRKERSAFVESKSVAPDVLTAEFNTIKGKLDDIQSQLKLLTGRADSQSKDALRFESDLTSFRTEVADSKRKISSMESAVSSLKADMDKDAEKRSRREEVEKDPVAVFNRWAQNPRMPLPEYFTYVAIPKPELRTKHDLIDTDTETDWIRNTIGEKKYIFPNPNKIDRISGPVDKLYKVDGTRKSLGVNQVKITSACEIIGNFIEYDGKLTLL